MSILRRHFFGLVRCDDDGFDPDDPDALDGCTFSWVIRVVPLLLLVVLAWLYEAMRPR